MNQILLPIEIGVNILRGWEGKVIQENPYIKLLSNPEYRNERWEALAQVNSSLCLIEVKPVKREL